MFHFAYSMKINRPNLKHVNTSFSPVVTNKKFSYGHKSKGAGLNIFLIVIFNYLKKHEKNNIWTVIFRKSHKPQNEFPASVKIQSESEVLKTKHKWFIAAAKGQGVSYWFMRTSYRSNVQVIASEQKSTNYECLTNSDLDSDAGGYWAVCGPMWCE